MVFLHYDSERTELFYDVNSSTIFMDFALLYDDLENYPPRETTMMFKSLFLGN